MKDYKILLITGLSAFTTKLMIILRLKKKISVFQVSRPYLGFCPNPKHFIVNCEQNVVKFVGKCIENVISI